jgi:hypothetical protein
MTPDYRESSRGDPRRGDARGQAGVGTAGISEDYSGQDIAAATPAQAARFEVRITSAITGSVKVFSTNADEAEAHATRRKIAKYGGCAFIVKVRP